MNLNQLLVACLLSSTAYSNPNVSVSFFAKVNGTLKALFPIPHRSGDGVVQVMSYGISVDIFPPTSFIVQWKSAYTEETNTPGYVGFLSGFLGFSSFMQEVDFDLDNDSKVRNTFYSCEVFHHKFPSILNEKAGHNCFEVELYLLPFDTDTKRAVKPVPPETPVAFFAKVNDTLEPLSGINLGADFSYLNMFIHRHPTAKPVEIIFSDNFGVIRKPQTRHPEYVVLSDGQMVYGPEGLPTTIHLSSEWRLLNGPFYSCALSKYVVDSVRGISRTIPKEYASHCFKVELFLGLYETNANSTGNGTVSS